MGSSVLLCLLYPLLLLNAAISVAEEEGPPGLFQTFFLMLIVICIERKMISLGVSQSGF